MRDVLRPLAFTVASLVLGACAIKPPPQLYLWGNFPHTQYDALLHPDGSATEQIQVLEAQAEKARATGAALPPGFRAHLGLLKLSLGDTEQARQLWLAEEASFPESAPYLDQLLKQLDGPLAASAPQPS